MCFGWRQFALCCLSLSGGLFGASATAGERDALASAIAHLAQQQNPRTWRFVWMVPDTNVTPEMLTYAINAAAGTTTRIVPAVPISDEVVAINLEAVDPYEPEKLLATFDGLAQRDPVFHVVDLLQDEKPVPILAPHLAQYVAQEITGKGDKRLDVIASELSGSAAPIYEARWLLNELLDRSYYDFRRLSVGDDLGDVLSRFGYFYAESKKQRGIRANFLVRSAITGDQRVVAVVPGVTSPTVASITYDQFDGTTQPAGQLVRNLSEFNTTADGSEWFLPMPNGLLTFGLSDGEFKLVDAAPSNLAVDHSKPAGHDRDLRPALSCISCHYREAKSIYQPFQNDYPKLPTAGLTAAETAELDGTFARALDTPDDAIGRAKRDYAVAVAQIVGTEEGAAERLHLDLVQAIFAYRYDLVTLDQASIELGQNLIGVELPPGEATDPEIALLLSGVAIPRKSFDAIRVTLAGSLVTRDQQDNTIGVAE